MGKKSLDQAMPQPSKKDLDYEAEDAMRVLGQAHEILEDSEKLKRVHKLAGRKHKGVMGMIEPKMKGKKIRNLDDLKKVAYSKKDDMEE